jgi:hypothetical protein
MEWRPGGCRYTRHKPNPAHASGWSLPRQGRGKLQGAATRDTNPTRRRGREFALQRGEQDLDQGTAPQHGTQTQPGAGAESLRFNEENRIWTRAPRG